MSIKGIDAQIMVTRTAEASKDISSQLKKGELFQNQLAVQGKTQDEHDNKAVMRTEDTEQAEIRQREEDSASDRRRGGDRRRKGRQNQKSDGDLPVGFASEHKIDIII